MVSQAESSTNFQTLLGQVYIINYLIGMCRHDHTCITESPLHARIVALCTVTIYDIFLTMGREVSVILRQRCITLNM